MSHFFKNYVWKNGIPVGFHSVSSDSNESYKIVSDPYRKRISIEKYVKGDFKEILYDSALLNFRHLKNPEHAAWQTSYDQSNLCYIRNQDDRLLYIENYHFKDHLCRECQVHSPHGFLLSVHKMYYKIFQDPFNGVVLYDVNQKPVMYKFYEFDDQNKQFTTLLKEEWDLEQNPLS